MFNINFCRKLDSNRGPLESETTALPTEPQPLKSLLTTEVALTMAPMLSRIYTGMQIQEGERGVQEGGHKRRVLMNSEMKGCT